MRAQVERFIGLIEAHWMLLQCSKTVQVGGLEGNIFLKATSQLYLSSWMSLRRSERFSLLDFNQPPASIEHNPPKLPNKDQRSRGSLWGMFVLRCESVRNARNDTRFMPGIRLSRFSQFNKLKDLLAATASRFLLTLLWRMSDFSSSRNVRLFASIRLVKMDFNQF